MIAEFHKQDEYIEYVAQKFIKEKPSNFVSFYEYLYYHSLQENIDLHDSVQ